MGTGSWHSEQSLFHWTGKTLRSRFSPREPLLTKLPSSKNDVTVIDLPDPDEYDCDEFYGLFCEARLGRKKIVIPLGEIEVRKGKPNHQLIDDYSYWFWNWR